MQLNFKNKYIYFSLEDIWENLNYHFKTLVNQLCTANSDDEFVQSINVPEEILIQIYKDVTVKPEGVAMAINHAMLEDLKPQLAALSNLPDVMAGTAQPNEAARIQIAIGKVDDNNTATLNAKILNGKTQILK
jgi:hypothetical protein